MQNDDVIWQIINHQFCSFKSKIARERTFCQNPYNVTGLCIRSACPLANSRYATIREEEGDCYLYIKTIERAHSPKNLWEKIKLPSNYTKALELVSAELEHFPKYLVHRNKQRLTKIHQMLIRMRKLKLRASPKIVTTNTKIEQREKGRERKALAAAQLDRAIEKELLERLRQATEGEIFNYPEKQYSRVLNKASNKFQTETGEVEDPDLEDEEAEGEEMELEEEEDMEGENRELEEEEEEDDEEYNREYNVEYVEDFEASDSEDEDGEEDMEDQSFAMGSVGSAGAASRASKGSLSVPLKSSLRSSSAPDGKKRKLVFDDAAVGNKGKGGTKAAGAGKKGASSNKARVEVEYELEEEGERVPAQLRILAAQAAQAHPGSGSGNGRPNRGSKVLRR